MDGFFILILACTGLLDTATKSSGAAAPLEFMFNDRGGEVVVGEGGIFGSECCCVFWLLLSVSEEAVFSYLWRSMWPKHGKSRIDSEIQGTKVFQEGQYASGKSSCSKIARGFHTESKGVRDLPGKNVPKLEINFEESM